ncbi:COP9 signalosome complex subunit 1 [Dictyostelium purpureum]|uniref:COP9 signalosome complex subunit 1 n=1 Tax=Dictyostelium purpureum TaxID=5786 RepID=F1A0N1_DICPU|nr:COP9 signalosome complex subunit 1 [Dictyostelium purpureum]EGC30252.1 COP9 signalosome complex subunit 1 [Dictyostelium purpureum]|eukprot:XP_003293224.1 COP9 signalosome complex subunit 1 [Dictyostelium purpureum]
MEVEKGSSSSSSVSNHQSISNEFDLEAYINNYTGFTKIYRLLFIAESCKPLEVEAFKQALKEVQKTPNLELYNTIVSKSHGILEIDPSYIEALNKKNASHLDKLELDLNTAKSNMIKDAIRFAQNDLGEFYYKLGDTQNAIKCFIRTRDYCTTSKHVLTMCFNIIKLGVDTQNYTHAPSYIAKAEQCPDLDNTSIAKLRSVNGLHNLDSNRYKVAAKKFIETPFEQSNTFSDIMSPQDIAYYGGLCALASFDRNELKKKVIDDQMFKNYLELVPELRELINDFYNTKYGSCLKTLDKMKPILLLDIHLHKHVESLYQKIRSKALIQYFSPYVSVDLNIMATAFNTTVPHLEREISKLIMDGDIQARIDSHNKRLFAKKADQRTTTFEKTMQVGQDFQNSTNGLLLRLEMLNNNISTVSNRKESEKAFNEFHNLGPNSHQHLFFTNK